MKYLWITSSLISQKSRLIKYFFKKNIKRLSLNLIAENAFFDISKYDELSFHKSTNRYYNNFVKNIDYKFVVSNDNVINDISKIHIKQKEFMKQKGILGTFKISSQGVPLYEWSQTTGIPARVTHSGFDENNDEVPEQDESSIKTH